MFTYLLLGYEEASNSSAPLVIGLAALVILGVLADSYVPRYDVFSAALLGAVCCHAALLKKSNTSYGCVCCTRKTKGYGVHSILGNLVNPPFTQNLTLFIVLRVLYLSPLSIVLLVTTV